MGKLIRLSCEIDQPWYEVDFRITRWACPQGLSEGLIQEIADATAEIDAVIASAAKLVNKYAHGIHSDPKRYVPFSQLDHLKLDFEAVEDQFELAKAGFAYGWQRVLKSHQDEIGKLSEKLQRKLKDAEEAYELEFDTAEVELSEVLRQFLEQIYQA